MTIDTKPDVTLSNNVAKVVMAIGVLIVIVAFVSISLGLLRTRSVARATRQWLGHLQAGDYTSAQAMLSAGRQRQIDPERLRALVTADTHLRGQPRLRVMNSESIGGGVALTGRIVSDAGEHAVEFRWLRETGPEGRRLMLDNVIFAGSSALFAEEAP